MPTNVVKNKADEKKWKKAKKIVAEQGQSERWPLVMHIFQGMKKDEDKKDLPKEFHEQLHSWWQANKVKALTPEQKDKLVEVKRSKIKLVKHIEELYGKFSIIRESLNKAKVPSQLKDWEPKEHHPNDVAKMQPHIDAGFHPREAAHLAGVRHAKDTPPDTKMTEFSPKMLELARDMASDFLKEHENHRLASAQPEHNPELHTAHKAVQAAKIHTGDYKNDLDAFKSGEEFKAASPADQGKKIVEFKLQWINDNKDHVAKLAQAAEAHKNAANEAQQAREQEKYEIRANILRGGGSGSGSSDDHEESSDMPDLDDLESV